MKSTATPGLAQRPRDPEQPLDLDADSAAVGSSITTTRASSERALAISTSCCSAIERPRAIRSRSSRTPSRSKISVGLGCIARVVDAAPGAKRLAADEDVLEHRQVGEQRRLLVDDRDPGVASVGGPAEDDLAPSTSSCPLSGGCTPAKIFTSVDLPAPFSPTSA